MSVSVEVLDDVNVLADTVAHRLVETLAEAQRRRGEATVVVTGGTTGIAVLAAAGALRDAHGLDWSKVNFWWGDERFVPAASGDRNALQAREALLDRIPATRERVHTMGGSDRFEDPDQSAVAYAEELAEAAASEQVMLADGDKAQEGRDPRLPVFDVLLLGVGENGHVASLMPNMDGIRTHGRTTVGVVNSPKPPPNRVSLTLEAINTAKRVWFVVTGSDKASLVAQAIQGNADPMDLPAAGPKGTEETVWFLDPATAADVPESLLG